LQPWRGTTATGVEFLQIKIQNGMSKNFSGCGLSFKSGNWQRRIWVLVGFSNLTYVKLEKNDYFPFFRKRPDHVSDG